MPRQNIEWGTVRTLDEALRMLLDGTDTTQFKILAHPVDVEPAQRWLTANGHTITVESNENREAGQPMLWGLDGSRIATPEPAPEEVPAP